MGFPGGSGKVKRLPTMWERPGSHPGSGSWEKGNGESTPVFFGQESLVDTVHGPQSCYMTEHHHYFHAEGLVQRLSKRQPSLLLYEVHHCIS